MISTIFTATHAKGGSGATVLSYNLAHLVSQLVPGRVLFLQLGPVSDIASMVPHVLHHSFDDLFRYAKQGDLDADAVYSLTQKVHELDVLALKGNFDDPGCMYSEEDLYGLFSSLRKLYQYIFIDCPVSGYAPVFQLSDGIVYFCNLDGPSSQLFHTFCDYLQEKGYSSKLCTILNQCPASFSRGSCEKHLGASLFATLPRDCDACIETVAFARPFVFEKKFPLSKFLGKLWRKLERHICSVS